MKGTGVPEFLTAREERPERERWASESPAGERPAGDPPAGERPAGERPGYAPPGRPLGEWRSEHLPLLADVGPALEHLLGSRTRARLLARVLADGAEPAWLRQIQRDVGMGASNVQRELHWFVAIGLLRVERRGGAHFYHVDREHPLYAPLRDLVAGAAVVDEEWVVPLKEPPVEECDVLFR